VQTVKDNRDAGSCYSAILLDKNMPPGIDGVLTAEKIRRIDPYVIIVLVTGDQNGSTLQRVGGFASDDRFFLFFKPFHAAELKQFLSAICAKSRLERELRSINRTLKARVLARTVELASARDRAEAREYES
jgi:DNA-binding NtrC family response regulator